jgi:hypothetical protein
VSTKPKPKPKPIPSPNPNLLGEHADLHDDTEEEDGDQGEAARVCEEVVALVLERHGDRTDEHVDQGHKKRDDLVRVRLGLGIRVRVRVRVRARFKEE